MKIDVLNGLYKVNIGCIDKLKFNSKVVVVSNTTLQKIHLDNFLLKIEAPSLKYIIIEDGEKYKTLSTVETILDFLCKNKIDRKSVLIGFGGGVVTDITGFVASIYQRGIGFVCVPTTLLSQVDASVGGKTGVNNRFGKNLIGSFHQPKSVHIDINYLKTLKKREFVSGVCEIIKMAVIFDKDFFNWLEENRLNNDANITYAIEKSIKIKSLVVTSDEKEQGSRAKLNYGHTFCHIIENETLYTKYLHGEAVGIGMIMANKLSLKLGLINEKQAQRIFDLIASYNLPIDYKIVDVDKFYELFFLDKKSHNNLLNFILPTSIGSGVIKSDILKSDIIDILNSYK
jgi:3-dehydroquinate synthase